MRLRYLLFLNLIAALLPLCLSAQGIRQDVIYLKNGGIYRGTIVEQVPGLSYKIELSGGKVILVQATEVEKITKEKSQSHADFYGSAFPGRPPFRYRERCFFFQGQAHLGSEFGTALIFGYKYRSYVQVGIGAGVDVLAAVPFDFQGSYNFPVFAYYCGDMRKRRITPCYSAYAGYVFTPESLYSTALYIGGPMGGAGLGVRIYSRSWTNLIIMATCTLQNEKYWNSGLYLSGPVNRSESAVLVLPGLNISVGF